MANKRIRERVVMQGQPYVDEPVFANPRAVPRLQRAVDRALRAGQVVGTKPPKTAVHLPEPITGDQVPTGPQRQLVGHERVKLRWMEPDGHGGLKPKKGD